MNYLLFNPLARNGTGVELKEEAKKELSPKFPELTEINVLEFNQKEFIDHLKEEDVVILVGGDGTLNHFANAVYGLSLKNKMFLYRGGTGNDFLKDIDCQENLIQLDQYLAKLPKVIINGKEQYFINGIGFGIDGCVCEEADKMKSKGKKDINYTSISIKLLLTKYRCPDAKCIIDGKEYNYKKVWLASSMNGQYYGGGMKVAPNQDRLGDDLSFVIMHGSNRLKTLMIFPSIFKGEHLNSKKYCSLMKAKHIEVTFSRPTALQIDGETISNVTHYEVFK